MGRDWRLSGRGAVKHPATGRESGGAGDCALDLDCALDFGFVLDDQKVDLG